MEKALALETIDDKTTQVIQTTDTDVNTNVVTRYSTQIRTGNKHTEITQQMVTQLSEIHLHEVKLLQICTYLKHNSSIDNYSLTS